MSAGKVAITATFLLKVAVTVPELAVIVPLFFIVRLGVRTILLTVNVTVAPKKDDVPINKVVLYAPA